MLYELSHYEAMTLQDACVAAQCRAEENAESAERCANDPNMPEAERASKSSILIGELAKILRQNGVEMGQNRLFEWLRRNGYLISRAGSDRNMPTQRAVEMGLLEIKETTICHSDGHASISKTPKVTGKGQIYFVNKLKSGLPERSS